MVLTYYSTSSRSIRQNVKFGLSVLLLLFSLNFSFSQDTTLLSGDWEDDGIWASGTSPGTNISIDYDLHIFNYPRLENNLDFNGQGAVSDTLIVYDTLVIIGDVEIGNNAIIKVEKGGIFIIHGDYLSHNQVEVVTGGYFIVTGEFEMLGSSGQGSFEIGDSGKVFFFDDDPQIKLPGSGYEDLDCDNHDYYPDSCGYGGVQDLMDDPIWDFFQEAICSGTPATPSLYGEFSVYEYQTYIYSTDDGMSDYTWIVYGGTIISNDTLNTVQVQWDTAGSGSISIKYYDDTCYSYTTFENVTINSFPFSCFQYRRQIDIDGSMVNGSSDLYNFTTLLKLDDDALKHIYHGGNITHYNGYDIAFSEDTTGSGFLKHQIDYYDPDSGLLYVWVLMDTLVDVATNTIYMYYGNYNISTDQSTELVWGDDYVGIYHMGESLEDFGQNGNDGINSGTETIPGKIGIGREFNRTQRDYILLSNEPDFRFDTTMTFSYWMYIDSYPTAPGGTNDWMDLLVKGDNVNYRLVCNRNQQNAYYAFGSGWPAAENLQSANFSVGVGTWIFVAGTWDGKYGVAGERKTLFINDVYTQNDPGFQSIYDFETNDYAVTLGVNPEAPDTRAFDGIMDEVRISNQWKSIDWIITEYNNQNDPASYITLGQEVKANTLSGVGGIVDVTDDAIYALEYTTATLTGSSGTIQWQSSTDNIDFADITGETTTFLTTHPLFETTYYRAMVSVAGCGVASTVDSVIVNPAYIDCEFDYRKRITISPSNVSGSDDLTYFPVLIDITHNDLRTTTQGGDVQNTYGYDIVFSAGDGVTRLYHELEEYDSVNGHIVVWVQLPILYASDTTSLYLYYGNDTITVDPSNSGVWSSDYIGVWHMDTTLVDATLNGNDGSDNNTTLVSGVNSMFGAARQFVNASNSYVSIANESNFQIPSQGKLTVSTWLYINSYLGSRDYYVSKGVNSWFLYESGNTTQNPRMYQEYSGGGGTYLYATNSSGINTGGWHYLVATFDHAVNNMTVYIDGDASNSVKNDPPSSNMVNNTNNVIFGGIPGATPANAFNGYMDEVRIQNVARTSDWIYTEYLNQSDPTNFIKIYNEESCSTDPTPGTASVRDSILCRGLTTEISLSGFTGSIYWQESTDSLTWDYITGESDSILEVDPITQDMYYRASVSTCCALYSNVIKLTFRDVDPPSLSFIVDTATCPGYNDGAIDMTITGGLAPINILWSTSETAEDISNLIADTYGVRVRDDNYCTVYDSVIVPEKPDTTSPQFTTCPTYPNISADGSCEATVPDLVTLSTVSDNCSAPGNITIIQTPIIGATIGLGVTTVQLVATDESGNTDTCLVDIIVVDDTDPSITCPNDTVRDVDPGVCYYTVNGTEFDPSASDNCSLSSLINDYNGNTTLAGEQISLGTYTIRWTAEDVATNSTWCEFDLEVRDTVSPTIVGSLTDTDIEGCDISAAPAAQTTVAGIEGLTGNPAISDNCTADGALTVSSGDAVAGTCPLVITRTYTITDASGNSSTIDHIINIDDTTVPTIVGSITDTDVEGCDITAAPAAQTTVAGIEGLTGAPAISDNCIADADLIVSSVDVVAGTCPIVITRTYTIEDSCGNSSTIDHIINIDDTTPPTIIGTISDTLIIGCDVSDAPSAQTTVLGIEGLTGNPDISDNCIADGDLIVSNVDVVAGTCPIVITRTYNIEDSCGNSLDIVHTIRINDTISPTLTSPATITVECYGDIPAVYADYTAFTTAGGSSNDNCGIDASTFNIQSEYGFNGSHPDTIFRDYEIQDSCGNIGICTHIIILKDTTPPTADPMPEIVRCAESSGGKMIDNIALTGVSDNCTPTDSISITYKITGTTDSIGTNDASGIQFGIDTSYVTYYIQDTVGNIDSVSFNVIIHDTPHLDSIAGPKAVTCLSSNVEYRIMPFNSISTYQWYHHDSITIVSSTDSTITVDFAKSDTVWISVVETNVNLCEDSISTNIIQDGCGLFAAFTIADTNACEGDTVYFDDLSTGITPLTEFTWIFGPGAQPIPEPGDSINADTLRYTSPRPTVAVVYNIPGAKDVSLYLREGVSDTLTIENNYLLIDTLTEIMSQPVDSIIECASDPIQFGLDARGTELTYTWQKRNGFVWEDLIADGNIQLLGDTVIITADTSAYTGTYRCWVSGKCYDEISDSIVITIYDLPDPLLTVDNDSICMGETAIFTGSGGDVYTFFVNGILAQTGYDSVYFTDTLIHNDEVYIIIDDTVTTCNDISDTITMTVFDLPSNISLTADDTTICMGNEVIFTAGSDDGVIYDFFINSLLDEADAGTTYNNSDLNNNDTVYAVVYNEHNEYYCSDTTSSIIMTVYDLPLITAIDDTTIGACLNQLHLIETVGTGLTFTYPVPYGLDTSNREDPVLVDPVAGQNTTYIIRVDDGNCPNADTVNITVPEVMKFTSIVIDSVLCNADTNGAITVAIAGGGLPYDYTWTEASSTAYGIVPGDVNNQTGLAAGLYYLLVTDNYGCLLDSTIEVYEENGIDLITFVSTINQNGWDVSYTGATDGEATVRILRGGHGGFTYLWNDPAAQTDSVAIDLGAGTYTVYVQDSYGCWRTDSVTLSDPDGINGYIEIVESISCHGFEDGDLLVHVFNNQSDPAYDWNDGLYRDSIIIDIGEGFYYVVVTDISGSFRDSISFNEPGAITAGIDTVQSISCFNGSDGILEAYVISGGTAPYTYGWSNDDTSQRIDSLTEGEYDVVVNDANECPSGTTSAYISSPNQIQSTLTSINTTCFDYADGQIHASVSGGVAPYYFEWRDTLETVIYSWGWEDSVASYLSAGPYKMIVEDYNDCLHEKIIEVGQPDSIEISFVRVSPYCYNTKNGSLRVNAIGGTPDYDYFWLSEGGYESRYLEDLDSGVYKVMVVDSAGCVNMDTAVLAYQTDICLEIATGFTPNEDGFNDVWIIKGAEYLEDEIYVEVYDRWGRLVYKSKGYNNKDKAWNGRFRNQEHGKKLPQDSYFYIVYPKNGLPMQKGTVTLIR